MIQFPPAEFDVDLDERTVFHRPSEIRLWFYEYQNDDDWHKSDSVTLHDNPKWDGDRMALARDAKEAAILAGMTARRPNKCVAAG
ncbi:MAG: hypothetical protein ACHQ50_15920 [Fimbriimonadales bacterium]